MPRVLLAALVAGAAALSAAPASAATHSCPNITAPGGGIDQIRVTNGFKCRDVLQTVGSWAQRPDRYGPPPWRCTSRGGSVAHWRCHIRTSFGGTKPLRTYRLSFRFFDA